MEQNEQTLMTYEELKHHLKNLEAEYAWSERITVQHKLIDLGLKHRAYGVGLMDLHYWIAETADRQKTLIETRYITTADSIENIENEQRFNLKVVFVEDDMTFRAPVKVTKYVTDQNPRMLEYLKENREEIAHLIASKRHA